MLPAAARLTRRTEFELAVRRGRRAGRARLVVHAYQERAEGTPRVGFVVGRNVGGSVVRHRVQRRLRHLLRDRLGELAPGTLLVVRALPPAAKASSAELAADLDSALRRLHPTPGVSGVPAAVSGDWAAMSGVSAEARPSLAARILVVPVRFYQQWIGPLIPPSCRFTPSCSEYAVQALRTHGAMRGLWLTVRRLLRCAPWHPGGWDPVPPPRHRTADTLAEETL